MSARNLSRLLVSILLLSPWLLSACAKTKPDLVIPDSLLVCKAAPELPEAGSTDNVLASYMLLEREAGKDCRTRLASVRELINKK